MHFMRTYQSSICSMVLLWGIILGTSNCFASKIKVNEVLSSIRNRDTTMDSEINHTATFRMLNQAVSFDPDQGDVFIECTVTWTKNDISMKFLYTYLQNPVYMPLDAGVYKQLDYDENKRLILWRPMEKYILSSSEQTEILDRHQLLYVSPDGDFTASGDLHTIKHVFPANGTHDGAYEFKHFLLAAGLGFSNYIDPDSSSKTIRSKNNHVLIRSHGNFGKDVKGTWELIVDPNTNFFVQNASFTNEKFDKPSVEVSTSNVTQKDGLRYARQGELIFSGIIKKNYQDIDILIKDDPELRQEVNQKMEDVLPGTERIQFIEEKPIRTTTK